MSTCAGISDGKLHGSTGPPSAASARHGGGLGAAAFGCSARGGLAAPALAAASGAGGGLTAIAIGCFPTPTTRICDNVRGANSFQSTSRVCCGENVGSDGPLKKHGSEPAV